MSRHSSSVRPSGLVEDRLRHARLADVVKERRHAEIVQLQLVQPESLAERDGEDADVDAVRERVLVVVANRRQADERRLFVEDLIDDALHDALDLLDVRAAAHAHGRHQVARRGDRLRVRALRALLRLLAIADPCSVGGASVNAVHAGARELLRQLRPVAPSDRPSPAACSSDRKTSQSFGATPAPTVTRPDAARAKERQQVTEAGEVVEIEPQPRRVDEDEFARHPNLELALAADQLLASGSSARRALSAPRRSRPDRA